MFVSVREPAEHLCVQCIKDSNGDCLRDWRIFPTPFLEFKNFTLYYFNVLRLSRYRVAITVPCDESRVLIANASPVIYRSILARVPERSSHVSTGGRIQKTRI